MQRNKFLSLFIVIFTLFINSNVLAINNYLSKKLPPIMQQLQKNTDELIAQRRTIDITKQALDALANRLPNPGISKEKAAQKKLELETIFANNLKNASAYQRAMYNIKRSADFV